MVLALSCLLKHGGVPTAAISSRLTCRACVTGGACALGIGRGQVGWGVRGGCLGGGGGIGTAVGGRVLGAEIRRGCVDGAGVGGGPRGRRGVHGRAEGGLHGRLPALIRWAV